MEYTVGEVAKILGVAPSILRFYSKEEQLPFIELSDGGVCVFKDADLYYYQAVTCRSS